MLIYFFSALLACGSSDQDTLYYRPPSEPANERMRAREEEIIIDLDSLNENLLNRPRHMPCVAVERKTQGDSIYRLWKWKYAYGKKGKLLFAHYFHKRKLKDPDPKINPETLFWNVRYEYDKKDRIQKYLLVTEKNLLVWWEIAYKNTEKGTEVSIVSKKEPVACLNFSSPLIQSRKCLEIPEVDGKMSFLIGKDGVASNGLIESKSDSFPAGTRLLFEYPKKDNPYKGKLMFFGWDIFVGQSAMKIQRPGGDVEDYFKATYEKEDDNVLTEFSRPMYKTEIYTGEACD